MSQPIAPKPPQGHNDPPAAAPIRVAVAHGNELVRLGLEGLLQRIGGYQLVLSAHSGGALIAACKAGQSVEVAVVHVHPPEPDGYVTLNWMQEHCKDVRVLALCDTIDDNATQQVLRSGAYGVLTTHLCCAELSPALCDAHTRVLHRNNATDRLLLGLDAKARHAVLRKPRDTKLAPRELELMRWWAHPAGLNNRQIAERMEVAVSSVHTWRDSIYAKLGIHSRTAALRYAQKNGIISG